MDTIMKGWCDAIRATLQDKTFDNTDMQQLEDKFESFVVLWKKAVCALPLDSHDSVCVMQRYAKTMERTFDELSRLRRDVAAAAQQTEV